MERTECKMRRGMPVIWELIKPLAVYYVGYYVVRILIGTMLSGGGKSFLIEDGRAIINGIAMLGGCATLFPMIMEEQSRQRDEKRQHKERSVLWYFVLMAYAVSTVVFFNMLISFWGIAERSAAFQETAARQYAVSLGMGLFLYAGVSAVVEEVVFRFLLYNRLRRSCEKVVYGVLASAFLFGIYHGNAVQGLYAFVLGVLIALTYVYFDDFLAPVVFHGLGNAVIFMSNTIPGAYDVVFTPAAFVVCGVVTVVGSGFLMKKLVSISNTIAYNE